MREVTPGILDLYLRYLEVSSIRNWLGVSTEVYYKLYIIDIGTYTFGVFNCTLHQIFDYGLEVTYSFKVKEQVGVYAHKVSYTETVGDGHNLVHLDRDDYGIIWWVAPGKAPNA